MVTLGATVLSLWTGLAAPVQIDQPVVDLANAIDDAAQASIAADLRAHHEATGVQMAVLLVDTTHGQDIADFSQEVFDDWGGGSAERDDGVLFVLAIEDRRNRLHLGYGIEPLISDAVAQQMLDGLRPSLRQGDYGAATRRIVSDVQRRTDHLRPGSAIAPPRGSWPHAWRLLAALMLLLGFAFGYVVRDGYERAEESDDAEALAAPWHAIVFARRPAQIVAALLVGIVATVVFALLGTGYLGTYLFAALLYFGFGWIAYGTARPFGLVFGVVVLGSLLLMGLSLGDVVTPAELSKNLFAVAIGSGAIGGVVGLMVWGAANSEGGGSYSSSSYSSSSYSSSSYSLSSYSSSSSSSSYSGGGGSSGGGGASSSW